MKIISVEVDEEFVKALEALEQPYLDRATLVKTLLSSGLKQYRIEQAIKKYLEGEVSTWKAAEIAGISLRKMNKILQEKGVEMHYSESSLKEDLE
jgi:predicted HTH domain antitoxin